MIEKVLMKRDHEKRLVCIIIIAIILIMAISQLGHFKYDWDRLISRCPVISAIVAKNFVRFGVFGIKPNEFLAVGNYPIERKFDVPFINHPLLNSLICAFFFKFLGVSFWVTKVWALVLGLLILLLFMLLAQKMFGDPLVVFTSGMIAAFAPITFYYSHYLDNWWSDIFYVIAIVYFYRQALEGGFSRLCIKMLLYFFTFLGCANSWRLFALPPLLMLHTVVALKGRGSSAKESCARFLKEYFLLFLLILLGGLWYLAYLHGNDLLWSIRNIYLKSELRQQIPAGEWFLKYFSIQNSCYTPVVYGAFVIGLWLFFSTRKIKKEDKLLLAVLLFWGVFTTALLINHVPYMYSLHNAFYVPVILLGSSTIVTLGRRIFPGRRILAVIPVTLFLAAFIINSRAALQRWPLRSFPFRSFEVIVNRNTSPDDIIGTNSDLTGLHDFSTDIRNPVNLHNMFFMDREIDIIKSTEEFLQRGLVYKYFVFKGDPQDLSDSERELFRCLQENFVLSDREGSFFIFKPAS